MIIKPTEQKEQVRLRIGKIHVSQRKTLESYGMCHTSEVLSCRMDWGMLFSKVKNDRLHLALLTTTKEAHNLGDILHSGYSIFHTGNYCFASFAR